MENIEETPQSPVPEAHANSPKQKNTLGLIALITGIVGFIFACIPGALIVGWVLLPVTFILALVSLFLKGKGKGLGITALILSVVGTVVGIIVFMTVVATAFDEAFAPEETVAEAPADSAEDAATAQDEESEAEVGKRSNPFPLGTTISSGDWAVTINSVDLDATGAILSENEFNEEPADGNVFIMANVTVAYIGDNDDGEMPIANIEYVTVDGNTVNAYDSMVVTPDELDMYNTLYPEASTTGNLSFEVPADSADDGTLAVEVSFGAKKQHVAVK